MELTLQNAKDQLDAIFAKYAEAGEYSSVVSPKLVRGKVYEAWVLAEVLQKLADEGFAIEHVGGTKMYLHSSPGPIDSTYPHFIAKRGADHLDVWTDTEFVAQSFAQAGTIAPPGAVFRHELDIVVVPEGTSGYPSHLNVRIGVECKSSRKFEKSMARAIFGVRRELSLLWEFKQTGFVSWPYVRAKPASVLLVYATDPDVEKFNEPGWMYGIRFIHLPLQ